MSIKKKVLRYWIFYIFVNLLNILNFNSKMAHFTDSSSWQLGIVMTCLLSFGCYQRMPQNTPTVNELKSMITAKLKPGLMRSSARTQSSCMFFLFSLQSYKEKTEENLDF